MDDITDYLFKIHNVDESTTYEEARLQFKTDYDRENPILKHEALVEFKKEYRESKKHLLMKGIEHEMQMMSNSHAPAPVLH